MMARQGKKPSREELKNLATRMTQKDIAKMFNVSPASVSSWVKAYGLREELRPRPTKEELVSLYEQGMTQQGVADKYGVHSHTVLKWQKKFGLGDKEPLRHSKRPPKKVLQEMYGGGMTQAEIANRIEVRKGTVSGWFVDYGIRTRGKHPDDVVYKDRDWLFEEYITKKRSMNDIAREQGVGIGTIEHWLKKFGVRIRGTGEAGFEMRRKPPIKTDKYFDDLMAGLLLSDGAVIRMSDYSARYAHTCQYKGYLEFIENEFGRYRIKCSPIYSGKASAHFKGRKPGKLYIFHQLQTLSYPKMKEIRDQWYPNGKKIVPRDIDYRSPIVWLHEYIGDGSISASTKFPSISFATQGFKKRDVGFLASELCAVGVPAHIVSRGKFFMIKINKKDVGSFLDFIGPPPPRLKYLYGYKWRDDMTKKHWIETVRPQLVAAGSIL